MELLQLKFEVALEKAERPLDGLAEQYKAALGEHLKELQKSGDLDEVLLVRDEITRFDKEKLPVSEISELKSLSRLQKIYIEQYDRALAAAAERLSVLKATYKKELEVLVRRLTVDGKLEEAIDAKARIARVGDVTLTRRATWERGMVLHYKFDSANEGGIADLSGSENHGEMGGDAKLEESARGDGCYLSLDGDGDEVRCPHDDSLVLTTDCTISLWIRPRELRDLRGLVSKYNPHNSYVFRTSGNSKKGVRVIFGEIGNNSKAETPLKLGDWVHIAVTLSNHNVAFYLNGAPDGEGLRPKQVPLPTNSDPVTVGSDVNERYFKGDIDDVRIFRRALGPEEIAKVYKSES